MLLQSNRLLLRPLTLSDSEALLDFRLRNREFFEPFEPVKAESHFTLEAQQRIILGEQRGFAQETDYHFGIFLRETGQLIGRLNLFAVVRGPWQNVNMGYSIDQQHNGQGYMSEAVGLAKDFVFGTLGLHRIQSPIMPHNIGSIRVLEKNGFRYEGLAERYIAVNGVWEDHNLYAMTREEWEN